MNKFKTLPPVLFLFVMCSLLFAACNGPYDIPPETGAFSLAIGEVNMRTIMPVGGTAHFAVYKLDFYQADALSLTVDRTNANLSTSVSLSAGTYELRVTAYTDAEKTRPAAHGNAEIIITTGITTSRTVNLETINDGGTGTFTWHITVSTGIGTASMTISPLNNTGTPEETINLKTTYSGSRELNTGYYRVTFSLSKDGQSIMPWEYLHIYQNLESHYTFTFTDAHFNTPLYTVTYQFNNGDGDLEADYLHGEIINEPPEPTWDGYHFMGWYTNSALTAPYTFGSQINNDITLYAKWEPVNSLANPFNVTNDTQLRYVGKGAANPDGYKGWTLSAHYKQTANITLPIPEWTRIGDDVNSFTGTYNGDGHTISGLYINATAGYQGMFGYIGTGGKVENLGLLGVIINNTRGTLGGIAGGNDGTIQNCYVSGSVTGTTGIVDAGGIAGMNYSGTIQNCYVSGSVAGTEAAGGIAGVNYNGTIQNCVALNSSITLTTGIGIGRISGTSTGTLQHNYAWSGMTGTTYTPNVTGKDGASITEAEAKTENAWTTAGFTFGGDSPWVWDDSGVHMPSLKNSGIQPWPPYLQ